MLNCFLYFGKWNYWAQAPKSKKNSHRENSFLIFSQKKPFLIFQEIETPNKNLYISRYGTFQAWKVHSQKVSYISGNGTF